MEGLSDTRDDGDDTGDDTEGDGDDAGTTCQVCIATMYHTVHNSQGRGAQPRGISRICFFCFFFKSVMCSVVMVG